MLQTFNLELTQEDAEALLTSWRSQIQKLENKIRVLEVRMRGPSEVRHGAVFMPSVSSPRQPSKNLEKVRAYLSERGHGGVTEVGTALGIPKTSVSSVFRNNPDIFIKDGADWVLRPTEPISQG